MAVDYFLKLDTVPGESLAKGFEAQIQVQSFSWGGSNVSTVSGSGGSGAGKVDLSDLNLMINFDKAVPKLFQGLTKGTHFKTATLSGVKTGSGNHAYVTLALTEVFTTSVQFSASSEVPTVSVSFTYKSCQLDYYTQDAEGTVTNAGTAKYDLTTNVTS